jgi:hypothetical protein
MAAGVRVPLSSPMTRLRMTHVTDPAALAVFHGAGDIRALARELAWSRTPLGLVSGWPQSLRSTVRTLVSSQYPMILTWRSLAGGDRNLWGSGPIYHGVSLSPWKRLDSHRKRTFGLLPFSGSF